jgi:glycosyltransferase involved in cell wall biosynthesis
MSRVVITHPHITYPGGATLVALETGQRLAQSGHDVHFVSIRHAPALTIRFPSLRYHDLGGPLPSEFSYWLALPRTHARFHRLVDDISPDVIVAHVFPANYWAFGYRALRPSVPCVWYCHEPSAFVHDLRVINGVPWPMRAAAFAANPLLQVVDRVLQRFADRIVVNSSFTARRVWQIYRRQATLAAPGVDGNRFEPSAKEQVVLAVGRLTVFKRFDMVLRAAATIKGEGVAVRWVIVGDGEEEQNLQELASGLGVTDCVELAGRLDDDTLRALFSRAAIVVVTSVNEPFGIVPLEAMAAGAAVICSDRGGPADTVEDGTTGLHFRSGDDSDFARKVLSLLRNPELAREMGHRGREVVLRDFTWERTTTGIRQAIDDAVRRAP